MNLLKKLENGQYDVEYYLINNVKYVPVDLPKSLKLKKIA